MGVFANSGMGPRDTPGARCSWLNIWKMWALLLLVLLFLPPRPVLGQCLAHPLHPGLAQCLRVLLLHHTWVTNPHLVPVAVSRDQLWLFQGNQQLSPTPARGSALWRTACAQPKTSLSFSSSHVKLFKRPLSAASTCNGCQVLFLSDNFWNVFNLWPQSGKQAQKAIKNT